MKSIHKKKIGRIRMKETCKDWFSIFRLSCTNRGNSITEYLYEDLSKIKVPRANARSLDMTSLGCHQLEDAKESSHYGGADGQPGPMYFGDRFYLQRRVDNIESYLQP